MSVSLSHECLVKLAQKPHTVHFAPGVNTAWGEPAGGPSYRYWYCWVNQGLFYIVNSLPGTTTKFTPFFVSRFFPKVMQTLSYSYGSSRHTSKPQRPWSWSADLILHQHDQRLESFFRRLQKLPCLSKRQPVISQTGRRGPTPHSGCFRWRRVPVTVAETGPSSPACDDGAQTGAVTTALSGRGGGRRRLAARVEVGGLKLSALPPRFGWLSPQVFEVPGHVTCWGYDNITVPSRSWIGRGRNYVFIGGGGYLTTGEDSNTE